MTAPEARPVADRSSAQRRRLDRYTGRAFWVRTGLVAVIDAFVVVGALRFAQNRSWAVLALLLVAAALVNWAYLNPRAHASRWLTPGLVLAMIFVVYPVLYTAYISFTNFQTGNILSKEQAIERLEQVEVSSDGPSETADMYVYRAAAGDLALLIIGEGLVHFGELRQIDEPARPTSVVDPTTLDGLDTPPDELGGYELLSGLAVTGENRRLQDGAVDLPDGSIAQVETLSSVRITTTGFRFRYDPDTDSLFDIQEARSCAAGEGTFFCDGVPIDDVQRVARDARGSTIVCDATTCDDVPLFAIDRTLAGWREVVGPDNYVDIITNDRVRAPFVRVLIWNVVYAVLAVAFTFTVGLALALALQDEQMRFRSIYRAIYIIPYAIPAFLSTLVWRGLLNADFGQVNGLFESIGLPAVDWLGDGFNAKVAVLLVTTWLGFPYMFLICSGALTSIPQELIEAARVDGAGPVRVLRTITMPLLLVSVAPLLIGSFAFNFNNFVLIFLLTQGGPPEVGYDVPVGSTDILISFTFDVAAGAGRGNQFGLASAIIVIIFLVLAVTSAMSFRLTKRLEEIHA